MNQHFTIAGIHIQIVTSHGFDLLQVPGMSEFSSGDDGQPQLRISLCDDTSPLGRKWEPRGHCFYKLESDGVLTRIYRLPAEAPYPLLYTMQSPKGTVYGLMDSHSCQTNWEAVGDDMMLKFLLWLPYAFTAIEQEAVPVHCSCVVSEGKAYLFLGESGTGKSTHTRLWMQHVEGARLLNDDCPILTLRVGRPWVYGSPWSGKTHCYHNQGFPVGALIRLSQHSSNQAKLLSLFEAFAALLPSCPPALQFLPSTREPLYSFVEKVIGKTPVWHLACRPDEEAVQTIRAEL